MNNPVDNSIPKFLRDIADDIERCQVSQERIKKAANFILEYSAKNNFNKTDYSEGDIQKFTFLGWYIYTQLPHCGE